MRICFGTLVPHRAAITVMQNDWNYLEAVDRFDYLTRSEDEVERMWVGQISRARQTGLFRDDIDARADLPDDPRHDLGGRAVVPARVAGSNAQGLAEHYIKVLFDGIAVH